MDHVCAATTLASLIIEVLRRDILGRVLDLV